MIISLISFFSEDMATQVQILNEAVYISHSANTIGKGINPTILSSLPAMGE